MSFQNIRHVGASGNSTRCKVGSIRFVAVICIRRALGTIDHPDRGRTGCGEGFARHPPATTRPTGITGRSTDRSGTQCSAQSSATNEADA